MATQTTSLKITSAPENKHIGYKRNGNKKI